MTSTSWSPVESSPSVEPSADLFDGDILGDELIDIYNAAVVGGGADDDALNEIPSLLAATPEIVKKEHEVDMVLSHPPASSDDGLGAFRPSTSFNDLTTLLPSATTAPAPTVSQPLTSLVTSTAVAPVTTPVPAPAVTHKRAPEVAPAEVPPAKRRASALKKNPTTMATKSKAKAMVAAHTTKKAVPKAKAVAAKASSKNDTPNPLTIGKHQPPTLAAKSPIAKNVAPRAGIGASPTVVTPRIPGQVKETDASKGSTAPAAPLLSNPPTEADFKSVAQAAVSNLIMNAGNAAKADAASSSNGEKGVKVDTSTEHIKALTGSNWVAVCSGGDANSVANVNADKMNNRARRQNLTPDERARQNRDRNREHARNTRLRKKAYVEELKRTLTALVSQRDATELEKRHSVQRELEQREVRFRVIEEFLKLRGRNEVNFARWAPILEDSFTLTLPVTDFRSMVQSENPQGRNGFEQVLTGVSETMEDSNLLADFVQSLTKHHGKGDIGFTYDCDRKNFFMDNCNAVLDWTASSQGAVKYGASSELTMKGNLKANFSAASNKLISVVMTFDTGVVVSQINRIFKDVDRHDEVAAAQVAASEADAILDSLQMPHIDTTAVPSNVTVVPSNVASGPASITDVEKEDSSDESNGETDEAQRLIKAEA